MWARISLTQGAGLCLTPRPISTQRPVGWASYIQQQQGTKLCASLSRKLFLLPALSTASHRAQPWELSATPTGTGCSDMRQHVAVTARAGRPNPQDPLGRFAAVSRIVHS